MDERPPQRLTIGAGALAGGSPARSSGSSTASARRCWRGRACGTTLATAALAAAVDAVLGVGAGRGGRAGRARRRLGPARAAARLGARGRLRARGRGGGRRGGVGGRWRPRCATTASSPAGLTALAALAAAVGGVVLAPAVARLLAGRARAARADGRRPAPRPRCCRRWRRRCWARRSSCRCRRRGCSLGPELTYRDVHGRPRPRCCCRWALALLAAVRLRDPLAPGARRWRCSSTAAPRRSRSRAAWGDNLRFAPWTDIVAGAAIAAVAAAAGLDSARPLARRGRSGSRWSPSRSGSRRSASSCASSPLEAGAQGRGRARGVRRRRRWRPAARLLDFDGDGYARALGGGDCDDRDPPVHPGALDIPGDGIDADCDGEDATDALPPPARMAAAARDGAAGPRPAAGHDRHAARRPPRLLRLRARRPRRRSTRWPPRGRCSRTAGRTRRRRATRCPRSPPAAGRRRSPGTSRSGGRASAPTCAPPPRRCTTPATSPAGCSASATSRSPITAASSAAWTTTTPSAPRCTSPSTGRWSRAARRRARSPTTRSRSSTRTATGSSSSGCTTTIRTSSYEPHPEVPSFGTVARRSLRRRDPLHRPAPRARCSRTCARLGLWDRTAVVLTGDHGEGFGEHGVTEHGFDLYPAQTKVPFIVRVPGLAPRRVRVPGRARRHRADAGEPGARAPPSRLHRPLAGARRSPGRPRADTDTRAVFQEVTSERGKKRALVDHDAAPDLERGAQRHDRVLRPRRAIRPRTHDIWQRHGGRRRVVRGAGARRSSAWSPALALPPGAAEKLARRRDARPGAAAPPPGAPAGGGARRRRSCVRGYDVSADRGRAPAATVDGHVPLRRRASGSPAGWRLFFHLEGPAGYRNLDHVPVEGLMPLERWRPGQEHPRPAAHPDPAGHAPGTYTLYLGAFRGAERLPVTPAALTDGKDRLRLFSFVVRSTVTSARPRRARAKPPAPCAPLGRHDAARALGWPPWRRCRCSRSSRRRRRSSRRPARPRTPTGARRRREVRAGFRAGRSDRRGARLGRSDPARAPRRSDPGRGRRPARRRALRRASGRSASAARARPTPRARHGRRSSAASAR